MWVSYIISREVFFFNFVVWIVDGLVDKRVLTVVVMCAKLMLVYKLQ
jgi:hypothetical protein